MSGTTASGRPTRADVTASYDRGVDGYVNLWSAVIQPPAKAVVAALGLAGSVTVADIGAGTGAMVPAIRQFAPRATVVAVDASTEMLRVACDDYQVPAVQADALALPVRDGCADAALLAFVLFHLSDPSAALVEAARVLRTGGTLGTVTWATQSKLRAYAVFDQTLTEAGAPVAPTRQVDTGLNSTDGVASLLAAAGLQPTKVWLEQLSHQWTSETYWQLAAGSGLNRIRLDAFDEQARATTLRLARQRLSELDADDLAWHGEVVCAIAMR